LQVPLIWENPFSLDLGPQLKVVSFLLSWLRLPPHSHLNTSPLTLPPLGAFLCFSRLVELLSSFSNPPRTFSFGYLPPHSPHSPRTSTSVGLPLWTATYFPYILLFYPNSFFLRASCHFFFFFPWLQDFPPFFVLYKCISFFGILYIFFSRRIRSPYDSFFGRPDWLFNPY